MAEKRLLSQEDTRKLFVDCGVEGGRLTEQDAWQITYRLDKPPVNRAIPCTVDAFVAVYSLRMPWHRELPDDPSDKNHVGYYAVLRWVVTADDNQPGQTESITLSCEAGAPDVEGKRTLVPGEIEGNIGFSGSALDQALDYLNITNGDPVEDGDTEDDA